MARSANDSVFPVPQDDIKDYRTTPGSRPDPARPSNGLTIRELYGLGAMIGILAGGMTLKANPPMKPHEVAQGAFNIADAMLAEAAKRT